MSRCICCEINCKNTARCQLALDLQIKKIAINFVFIYAPSKHNKIRRRFTYVLIGYRTTFDPNVRFPIPPAPPPPFIPIRPKGESTHHLKSRRLRACPSARAYCKIYLPRRPFTLQACPVCMPMHALVSEKTAQDDPFHPSLLYISIAHHITVTASPHITPHRTASHRITI